jgi:acetyl esterase
MGHPDNLGEAGSMIQTDRNETDPILEPITQQFVEETGQTFLALPPDDARKVFSHLQSSPVGRPGAEIVDMTFPTGPTGSVEVRIIRPKDLQGPLPVVIYCHGGGWIAGDTETHDRLIREIAVGASAALVFVCYDRAPEAGFPIATEQVYAATLHVVANASALNVDATRLAIIGDCAGGAIAASVAILVRERRGPNIDLQILICPVTAANFNSRSYERFAMGPWLTRSAMLRVWDHWSPDVERRDDGSAAPLRAPLDHLSHLPAALIITAENDVTRDEAECYARRLSEAGVRVTSVRYNGTIHDFAILNALADTPAARGAIFQITDTLRQAFG